MARRIFVSAAVRDRTKLQLTFFEFLIARQLVLDTALETGTAATSKAARRNLKCSGSRYTPKGDVHVLPSGEEVQGA